MNLASDPALCLLDRQIERERKTAVVREESVLLFLLAKKSIKNYYPFGWLQVLNVTNNFAPHFHPFYPPNIFQPTIKEL